jgi:hypothetical protein
VDGQTHKQELKKKKERKKEKEKNPLKIGINQIEFPKT